MTRTRTRILLALTTVALAAGLTGCNERTSSVDFGETATAELALTDPALMNEVRTLVAATFFVPAGQGCVELLELSGAELDAVSEAQEPIAGAMAIPALDAEGEAGRHGFGGIYAPGEYAFMLLGSTRPFAEYPERGRPLEEAAGTIVAMGCRQASVLNDERQDLKITLFPAGVR